jgi:bifunctional UDP-N-acetylglucosamine pyrophosphorylase/glucosamine-1-phosphate N-acetyltransferase
MTLVAIVMAAGRGTRLRASLSKMLLPLDGQPLVSHAVRTARSLRPDALVVVVGHQRAAVEAALRERFPDVGFALQDDPRGTGDAVARALGVLRQRQGTALVLSGDVPLLRTETLRALVRARERERAAVALLTMTPTDPAAYGRILRREGRVVGIVEHADATPAERQIAEVNAGVYAFDLGFLRRSLGALSADNEKAELYLTDLVALAAFRHQGVVALPCADTEVLGVNTWAELAGLERIVRERVVARLMAAGVHVVDPARTYVESSVRVAPDTTLGPGVCLLGRTRLGRGCRLEAGVWLRDVVVGEAARLGPYCVIDGGRVPPGAAVNGAGAQPAGSPAAAPGRVPRERAPRRAPNPKGSR